MSDIDNLSIQITADARTADTAVDNLINTLDRLVAELKGVNTQKTTLGRTTQTLSNGMNTYTRSATRASRSTFNLASAIGKFYASYFLVIRGIRGLWNSIESTTDYIEAFNYFNVAFGKIASEWQTDWDKYGYENADAYAQSFTERISESLGKLSGVQVDTDRGLLLESQTKNLGLNIQEITQYASQLASVTNSLGQTGETSLAISSAFTKLAGDISSLFNVDYSSVAKNLQSALIGQSRSVYKFGIDITNATLQTKAYELGLTKAVSEMTQMEKQQLRVLAILEQSRVSWGDLANTIQSPSNMIRQFRNNMSELGMILGQLFIPVLQSALPILNGLSIALKRLLGDIAGFIGVKLDLDSFGQGYVDLGEDVDNLTGSIDDATEATKKFKSATIGIDQLNIISPTEETAGTGPNTGQAIDLTQEILNATNEYEKVWNKAYEEMENKAQKIADAFSVAFKPVAKIFEDVAKGDWFAVGQDTSNLVAGIFNFFSNAIKSVDWDELGENIGEFLKGINWKKILTSAFRLGFNIWDAISDAWVGSFSAAPLETALITALGGLKFTGFGTALTKKITESSGLSLSKIFSGVGGGLLAFGTYEDSFYNLHQGITTINEEIVKIGLGSGVAAGLLYSAFGPTGLAFGAVAGLAGALFGINRSVEQFANERMLDAFIDNNGQDLADLTTQFEDFAIALSSPYKEFNEQFDLLGIQDQTIDDLINQMNNLGDAMANGQSSAEERKDEIIGIFDELNSAILARINSSYDLIDSMLGGQIGERLEGLGVDVEGMRAGIAAQSAADKQRVQEITTRLEELQLSGKTGTKEYRDLRDELNAIGKTSKDVEGATEILKNFSKAVSDGVDFSKFVVDGELDFDAVKKQLSVASSAYQTSAEEIETYYTNVTDMLKESLELGGITQQEYAESIQGLLTLKSQDLANLQDNYLNTVVTPIKNTVADGMKEITAGIGGTNVTTGQRLAIEEDIGNYVYGIVQPLDALLTSELEKVGINGKSNMEAAIDNVWAGALTPTSGVAEDISSNVSTTFENAIKNGLEGIDSTSIQKIWQSTIEGISSNSKFDFVFDADWDPSSGRSPVISVTPSWTAYATGGFPEDGLFFANHNELVGKFSNGKTAVANNAQIVAGIEQGVRNAMYEVMANGGFGGNITINNETTLDGRVVGQSVNKFNASTGKQIFGNQTNYNFG